MEGGSDRFKDSSLRCFTASASSTENLGSLPRNKKEAELFLSLKGKHSLMVVEHDMGFIRQISDIVTVLCDGAVLAQGSFAQVQADERVIDVYLGR
jgi:ABC-type uncharacterized transport system ATPase subunit